MRNRLFMKRDNRWRERPGSATLHSPNHESRTGPRPHVRACNRISVKRRRDFGSPLGSQSEIPVTKPQSSSSKTAPYSRANQARARPVRR
jgi:carbamoyl-phosphate synthase small subunit